MARPWTTTERRIVRKVYPVSGAPGVQLAGVERTATSIIWYANVVLKLRSGIRGRTARVFTLDGVTTNIKGHAKRLGLNPDTVYSRINKSRWPVLTALRTPTGKYDMTNRRAHGNGQ